MTTAGRENWFLLFTTNPLRQFFGAGKNKSEMYFSAHLLSNLNKYYINVINNNNKRSLLEDFASI